MRALVYRAVEVDLKPGDTVEFYNTVKMNNRAFIIKLVETHAGVRVVFSNNTWRPLSTFGVTWVKVC